MLFVKVSEWLVERNWLDVVIEGDAISIVNRLTNPILDLSIVGQHLKEAHSLLRQFPLLQIGSVNRLANKVAHSLAH
ncbi:hypothetical protein V6N12_058355 [Hibiscus sabdariffa]|uniref:RNase H type-1 domain-containing protein n=1 Tax=Hibiscus sabdariffa TaxID=183260 RepID=A0ABR2ERW4_9ROSI